jgi:hypothetical protein
VLLATAGRNQLVGYGVVREAVHQARQEAQRVKINIRGHQRDVQIKFRNLPSAVFLHFIRPALGW